MKHYTSTIPLDLAEKLKAAGMPLGNYVWMPNGQAARKDEANLAYYDDQLTPYCTYADVFDWLMEKELHVSFLPTWDSPSDAYLNYEYRITELYVPFKEFKDNVSYTWHEAADAAIEKALELIKEEG